MKFSQDQTWYDYTVEENRPKFEPLAADTICDICIIGGGFSAVIAALRCAEEGQDVVVLESSSIAYGASGRDGSHLVTGFNMELEELEYLLGEEDAHRFWEMTYEARSDMIERIQRYDIDCMFTQGLYVVAKNLREEKILKQRKEDLEHVFSQTMGHLDFLTTSQFREKIACEHFSGALFYKNSGFMHPLKFLYALVDEAVKKGVRFYEKTSVDGYSYGKPHKIHTASGLEVTSKHLILCGNAYMPEVSLPHQTARAQTMNYYQWVSMPLEAEEARLLNADRSTALDMKPLVNYFTLTLDNRVIVGGVDLSNDKSSENLAQRVEKKIKRVCPHIKGLKPAYFWHGKFGVKKTPLPIFEERFEHIYVSHAVSGQGLVCAYMAGLKLAEAALGYHKDYEFLTGLDVRDLSPTLSSRLVKLRVSYMKVKSRIERFFEKYM